MKPTQLIARLINHQAPFIEKTIELLELGNTIPFIARYRKEVTGHLDEEQLRTIQKEYLRIQALEARRQAILSSIEEQQKLTPNLEKAIRSVETMTALEDLYQPFRKKRKTRADKARELGLLPLAEFILAQPSQDREAQAWISRMRSTFDGDDEQMWKGARDIIAERISDHPEVRGQVRTKAMKWSRIRCEKVKNAEDEKGLFRTYYEFENQVSRIRPHQILAIDRGESEKILKVKVETQERDWYQVIQYFFPAKRASKLKNHLEMAIEDAANRLLLPAISRDVRKHLTEVAQEHAVQVFAKNLEGLLLQPPLKGMCVLGIDPAFRTGCKMAAIDANGHLLGVDTIYPHAPQNQKKAALESLEKWVTRHNVSLIAIGNGTASRETEQLVADFIKSSQKKDLRYVIVNEAGASVYSASPLARQEFPDLDVSVRGAVSIARRIQDPLAELVKIDPKSIGVGMYQHDLNQKKLEESLSHVVESVVNRVGVQLNTASASLLQFVSGIGPKLASDIEHYRTRHTRFQSREELKKIKGLGAKAFEQAAGFLRIRHGNNPLDASAIHPECYAAAQKIMDLTGLSMSDSVEEKKEKLKPLLRDNDNETMARSLGVGVPTLMDIINQIIQPGRDPREDIEGPVLRSDVIELKDLKPGMVLDGTVRNVVDFGAFIDVGVKQDGLLHRSKVPAGAQLVPGMVVQISILEVDLTRQRISFDWT